MSDYAWATLENIATIAAVVVIWCFTGSAWSLLLLMNLNTAKVKK